MPSCSSKFRHCFKNLRTAYDKLESQFIFYDIDAHIM